jgi:hypothetical protein
MKRVFLVAAAALLGATAAEAATTTSPGATGAAPSAPGGPPMQNFGPSPGMPGSVTYDPNAALPSLGNSGSAIAPDQGSSATGVNTPSTNVNGGM